MTKKIKAFCFDTTASNTGRLNGVCVLLEQMLGEDNLCFPCRHHIHEIVLKAVFDEKLGITSGPDTPIFKRFQKSWSTIKKENYQAGIDDPYVRDLVRKIRPKIITCLKNINEKYQPREDYRELLQLALWFLGETPSRGAFFRVPGAVHHTRWISRWKAIY